MGELKIMSTETNIKSYGESEANIYCWLDDLEAHYAFENNSGILKKIDDLNVIFNSGKYNIQKFIYKIENLYENLLYLE